MADGKYYWIKLKRDLFADDSPIDFLLSQPNGSEYVVLYLKLCLLTANTGGRMANQIGEIIIPYDAEKIQRDVKHFSIDTVRVALELYKKLGLIYMEEGGVLVISNYQEMVGSETKWASYKRIERLDNVQLESKAKSKQSPVRDKSIEIRDKSIDIRENNKEKYFPEDDSLDSAFASYVEMRKKIKAPMTAKAVDLAIGKLRKMSGGNNDVMIEILEQSIMNSWKGLFPLKENKQELTMDDVWRNA